MTQCDFSSRRFSLKLVDMTQPGLLPAPAPQVVDLFTRTEPRALINLVPPQVQEQMLRVQRERPEYLGLEERGLWKKLSEEQLRPTPTDNRLRMKFWMEYDRAQADQSSINMTTVFAGVCSRDYFFNTYLQRPDKIAWMLQMPANYQAKMEEALDFGVEKLREILEMDDLDSKGRPNVKLLELKAKIVAMFDLRVKGGITQRVEQKNMNLHVSTNDKEVAKAAMMGNMEDIQKRIKELERRDRIALQAAEDQKQREATDGDTIEAEVISSSDG